MGSMNGQYRGKKLLWEVTVYKSQPTGIGYQIRREVQMMPVDREGPAKEYAPFIRHGGVWFRVYQSGPEKYILTEEAST